MSYLQEIKIHFEKSNSPIDFKFLSYLKRGQEWKQVGLSHGISEFYVPNNGLHRPRLDDKQMSLLLLM